jgi:outer membrane protein
MKKEVFQFNILVFSCLIMQAQSKKWTLQECVNISFKNISIKQSELDTKTALIDKESAFGNFLPSVNAVHLIPGILV